MIVLSVEAGIIANVAKFIAEQNNAGLRAGVGKSCAFISLRKQNFIRRLGNHFADF